MALTKLTADVENIQALSDKPNEIEGLTADQLKAKFDKAGSDIKTYLNDTLVDELDIKISDLDTRTTIIENGWYGANETWTYTSVDDPTGVITISGDKTTKYSLGMRIMFTNATNVIYGIITAISYSSPNTTLTFLHEIDSTDNQALYLMQNSVITNNYYSSVKAPYGFPLNPNKWSILVTKTTMVIQTTPVSGTWYNTGEMSINIPIGLWKLYYRVCVIEGRTGAGDLSASATLSEEEDVDTMPIFTTDFYTNGTYNRNTLSSNNVINISSKTRYYLLIRGLASGALTLLRMDANESYTIIKAECAYL